MGSSLPLFISITNFVTFSIFSCSIRGVVVFIFKAFNSPAVQSNSSSFFGSFVLFIYSAPLIPVMEGITIMPLIGTIDTERAKLIMENLLEGAIKHNSEVVLIDITGVPVVDTMVAHHIIQAAEAVRLIGSTCILVGIRPEIAQTIVNLGIDLSNFPTKSSLKKGFSTALAITGRHVTDLNVKENNIEKMMDSLRGE